MDADGALLEKAHDGSSLPGDFNRLPLPVLYGERVGVRGCCREFDKQ